MHVLIADDHRLIVEGVKDKLRELDPAVVVEVAASADELSAWMDPEGDVLDLAIIDIGMPGTHGFDHIEQMRRQRPDVPLIVLSGAESPELIRNLLDLGVLGFIPKAYSSEVMLSAIRLVLAGGVYVPPLLLGKHDVPGPSAAAAGGQGQGGLRDLLTERQVDVVRLLSQGKPNKLIARQLGISEGTVKIHLAAIFRALNVRNRVEAVVASRNLSDI